MAVVLEVKVLVVQEAAVDNESSLRTAFFMNKAKSCIITVTNQPGFRYI